MEKGKEEEAYYVERETEKKRCRDRESVREKLRQRESER